MTDTECIVIGAGAVGLAIARTLGSQHEVAVLEQHSSFGQETSSRNSSVIHAGIYYPANFLKTRLCIAGNKALYDFCIQHNIPHLRCGKLIAACHTEEIPQLQALQQKARANGVDNLQWLEGNRLQELEPDLNACAALFSPDTGIIDNHAYQLQLVADIEQRGGKIVYQQTVTDIQHTPHGFVITINHQDKVSCKTLVNAAGLNAQQLAASVCPQDKIPARQLAKGHYYQYQGSSPFRHLVYPLPSSNNSGLGIHATLDLSGRLRFGPDVEYIDTIDYCFNNANKPAFVQAIKRYFPALDEHKLQPDFTGIRPKIQAENQAAQDFMIHGAANHGISNYVQLFGIESPGLTASLAIGNYVAQLLAD